MQLPVADLRDYFAAQALIGLLAAFASDSARALAVQAAAIRGADPKDQVAFAAYEYADAMRRARIRE